MYTPFLKQFGFWAQIALRLDCGTFVHQRSHTQVIEKLRSGLNARHQQVVSDGQTNEVKRYERDGRSSTCLRQLSGPEAMTTHQGALYVTNSNPPQGVQRLDAGQGGNPRSRPSTQSPPILERRPRGHNGQHVQYFGWNRPISGIARIFSPFGLSSANSSMSGLSSDAVQCKTDLSIPAAPLYQH